MDRLFIDSTITFLEVADLERSDLFYCETLGLPLVLDQGGCRIYRLTETSYLGVCERSAPSRSNVIVTVVAEDVDGWYQRLRAAGVETDGPPRDNDQYRIYQFFATDPDGHTFEFQRFWHAGWAG